MFCFISDPWYFKCEGASIVKWYDAKLSWTKLMVVAPDGRTLNGVDHQIDVLGSTPVTQHYADDLATLKKRMSPIAALRPANALTVDIDILHSAIDYIAPLPSSL